MRKNIISLKYSILFALISLFLFRADKMKIPMEIPEATENATKEVIEFEKEAEIVS